MTNSSFTWHIISSFKNLTQADEFYNELKNLNYNDTSISIFMSESAKHRFEWSNLDQSTSIADGAGTWSVVWGTVGAIAGIILWLWASAIIPGLWIIVAGPLLGGLVWAWAGSATGTVLWSLIALWLSDDYAKKFENDINEWEVVIAVDPRAWEMETIEQLAKNHDVHNLYVPSE